MQAAEPPISSIFVNGDPRPVPVAGLSIDELLGELGLTRSRVAVAVNRDVVPRSCFAEARVARGDRIEILEAVGGG